MNGDVPVRVSTMDAAIGQAVSTPRFRTVLLGLFAGVALALAMAGVYGVVSFSVSQRTSELALRMALGARRGEILRLTLAGGLRLAAVGVLLGWAAALALAKVLASMLYATSERDPIVFAAVPATLLAAAALASLAPALRAARVDPVVALRTD